MFTKTFRLLALSAFIIFPLTTFAQEDSGSSNDIEEITVTGSQIKGAKITGALPVSVLDFQDVEALGVDSGDELLENVVENGMTFFNEAENASGGVNSSRGAVGAYTLRNMVLPGIDCYCHGHPLYPVSYTHLTLPTITSE